MSYWHLATSIWRLAAGECSDQYCIINQKFKVENYLHYID